MLRLLAQRVIALLILMLSVQPHLPLPQVKHQKQSQRLLPMTPSMKLTKVSQLLYPSYHATLGTATGTVTITDNDPAPTISINDVSTSSENATSTNLVATLSAASGKAITVDFATSNGTATAGSDYTASSGTLTFAAGTTTKNVPIAVLADAFDEPNETQ